MTEDAFRGQAWKEGQAIAHVLAVADGYAMMRFKGCVPFVISVNALNGKDRWGRREFIRAKEFDKNPGGRFLTQK